ncbi:MAG: peptidoglycan editing factor PgeF [Melioribacteraceae bacterium]|nr:peptidoglycan editing factor PgeF [Melioribacteraceae bacterium]MCF8265950.1 peptidoglycan editing factor PgeF [Melioribacteraceae bacterium]MCF8432734.1 peptidoglycan editing factor PgeF [Melioribacteraceae bacterium]
MKIITSQLFEKIPNVEVGFSTKIGLERKPPLNFNMSLSVGDEKKAVLQNRAYFFKSFGLALNRVQIQKQVHGDRIQIIEKVGELNKSDAMITAQKGIGLAISSADCNNIYLYDSKNEVIAGVHSGWKSTSLRILEKTLIKMSEVFNSKAENIFAWVGPAISGKNYEVKNDVATLFDFKYQTKTDGKIYLDLKTANLDMLKNFGVPPNQIEISPICSFEDEDLHSFRREGAESGRAFGLIKMDGVSDS